MLSTSVPSANKSSCYDGFRTHRPAAAHLLLGDRLCLRLQHIRDAYTIDANAILADKENL